MKEKGIDNFLIDFVELEITDEIIG